MRRDGEERAEGLDAGEAHAELKEKAEAARYAADRVLQKGAVSRR